MDFTLFAVIGLVALICVIFLSAIDERLHPGFVSIAVALLLGVYLLDKSVAEVFEAFPLQLFFLIFPIVLLFSLAHQNGTLPFWTDKLVGVLEKKRIAIPLLIYLVITVLTAFGLGSVSTVAIVAPAAMAIGSRVGLSPFCVSLLVVGAANAAAFSQFATTGLIAKSYATKVLGNPESANNLVIQIALISFIVQTAVHWAGFLLFGGLKWLKQSGSETKHTSAPVNEGQLNKAQRKTSFLVVLFFVTAILFSFPSVRNSFQQKTLNLFGEIHAVAFLILAAAILMKLGNLTASLRNLPWNIIFLICGISMLIEIVSKLGTFEILSIGIGKISNPQTIDAWLAFFAGTMSTFSSSSGVVLPTFFSLMPELESNIVNFDTQRAMVSVAVGAHMVDVSPLSSLGALCVASVVAGENRQATYRKMFAWSLAMIPIGSVFVSFVVGMWHFD